MWSKWTYKHGKTGKDHKRPINRQIVRAMDTTGYFQKLEYYMEDDTRTTQRVYENIKTTDLVRFILGEEKG